MSAAFSEVHTCALKASQCVIWRMRQIRGSFALCALCMPLLMLLRLRFTLPLLSLWLLYAPAFCCIPHVRVQRDTCETGNRDSCILILLWLHFMLSLLSLQVFSPRALTSMPDVRKSSRGYFRILISGYHQLHAVKHLISEFQYMHANFWLKIAKRLFKAKLTDLPTPGERKSSQPSSAYKEMDVTEDF